MTALVACPACHRHIRVDHERCPFCASVVPADFKSRVVPGARRRLDRVATFTFAASLTVAACSGSTTDDQATSRGDAAVTDAGSSTGDAAIADGGASDARVDDDGSVVAMYGLPQPVDSGLDAAVDAASDGGAVDGSVKDGGGVQPLYGLPPGDGGL